MARYDWINSKGAWIPDSSTDLTCAQLRASWANEVLPKRIARCFETKQKVKKKPKPPVSIINGDVFPDTSPPVVRDFARARTLGQREVINVYPKKPVEAKQMDYPMEAGVGMESFIHRRLIGAAGGFLSGGPTAAVAGFLGGGKGGSKGARAVAAVRTTGAMATRDTQGTPFCFPPLRLDPLSGECKLFVGQQEGPDPGRQAGMPVFKGETGRPLEYPGAMSVTRLRCRKGFVLNTDNLCEWGLARNSRARKWRPGRKPLFTGGDLNAIKKAESLSEKAENIFKVTNPDKKAVSRSYRSNWRKPLKK